MYFPRLAVELSQRQQKTIGSWAVTPGWTPEQLRRFFNYVLIDPQGCWQWKGGCDRAGYACFYKDATDRAMRAHRASYEIFIGKIPVGLSALHRCDNRACVSPAHLFLGSHVENMRDMVAKGRHRNGAMMRRGAV